MIKRPPQKPICAKCRREVERMECHENPCTMAKSFRVYCHGETEEVTITDFEYAVADSISPGIAFAPKPALPDRTLTP